MPPHALDLKVGAIVMLIRNINMKQGLCNGTRCIVRQIYENFLDVEIIGGNHQFIGQRYFIPRIDIFTKGSDLPFTLFRRQFPVKLAFCMTINKAQGQTFKKIGLYLPQPVFSHGQLYVALSRVPGFDSLRIKILDFEGRQGEFKKDEFFTQNVVYHEHIN